MTDRREQRERFLADAQGLVPYLVADRDGVHFVLPTGDPTLSKLFVASEKHKERDMLRRALERLEDAGVPASRTTFLDVGANVGTVAFAALQTGFERVIACEPVPESVRLLRANLALNDAEDRVRVVEVAVSDGGGELAVDVGLGSRKARMLVGPAERDVPRVRAASLDDLVAAGVVDPGTVGFVLMDVEGHEPHVLDGGSAVFGTGVPLVLELNPKLLHLGGRSGDFGPLLARYYTHVLDLRDRGAELVPLGEVPALVERYEGRSTDLLACRLDRD